MTRRAVRVERAVYWDASAVLSALVHDRHSAAARRIASRAGTSHFVSSLASAEVLAVLGRLERERALSAARVDELRARLSAGPWRRSRVQPDADGLGELARRHPLRGADLWHLAAALALGELLPGLRLLTFDDRLGSAASAEGLSP